jgi:hypothetical protein
MFGDELEDLRDDLRGFPLASRMEVDAVRGTEGLEGRGSGGTRLSTTVGDGKGEERGKGTAEGAGRESKDETSLYLSRKGGRWPLSSSSLRLVLIVSFVGRGSGGDSSGESSSSSRPSWKVGRGVRRRVGKAPREAKAPVGDVLASEGGGTMLEKDRLWVGRPGA